MFSGGLSFYFCIFAERVTNVLFGAIHRLKEPEIPRAGYTNPSPRFTICLPNGNWHWIAAFSYIVHTSRKRNSRYHAHRPARCCLRPPSQYAKRATVCVPALIKRTIPLSGWSFRRHCFLVGQKEYHLNFSQKNRIIIDMREHKKSSIYMNQHLSMKTIFPLPTLAFFSSVILNYHRFF